MQKPDWWPKNPYPKDIFPMPEERYPEIVPDSDLRTALSGMLGRQFWNIASEAIWEAMQENQKPNQIVIVAICGSSRFADIAAVAAWELEKQGKIALGLHLLPGWYADHQGGHLAEAEGVAEILDELHLRKIEMADEVLVLNVGGYIGERTAIEIEYANSLGKPVRYLEAAGSENYQYRNQGKERLSWIE